jgi:hypothetical protein
MALHFSTNMTQILNVNGTRTTHLCLQLAKNKTKVCLIPHFIRTF